MMKFLVKQQKIEVLEREVLASDQIAFVSVKFVFDGVWKTLHKVVQFTQCEETYNLVLGTEGTTCLLPAELHPGAVKMSLFGYDAESDTTLRATTVPVTLHIRPSGFVADGDTPIPPTPDLYTQLLKKLSEMQTGANGKDGRSAYEIAIENGFVGTVAEWLESLKGRDGIDGKDGLPGKDGKDGADGSDGEDGTDGANGKDGITPKLEIREGYWYISYDNESTWTQLGKATGEDGEDGISGDPMFTDIDYETNTDYVIFTLSNGTQIKLPTWSAFEALKTLCNQMNTNISSLQTIVTALQNNDYITEITPVMQDGIEIGYTIRFNKSNPITIYHGKDGQNGTDGSYGKPGADGQDGHTAVISVKQDTDGGYYWTLDGN